MKTSIEHRIAHKLGASDVYGRRVLGQIMSETPSQTPCKRLVQVESVAAEPELGIGVPPAGFGRENAL